MTVEAVTWLFVPGNVPERFEKAVRAGAGAVVVDLEDAVRRDDKSMARAAVVDWLAAGGEGWVRVNDATTRWFDDDIDALAGSPGLAGVMLPKAEDPGLIAGLSAALGRRPLVALVETALGFRSVEDLADTEGIERLAFGSLDLAAELNVDVSSVVVQHARSSMVLASSAAGLPAPVDGVTSAVRDSVAVEDAARASRVAGFGGKLCIHPAQVEPTIRAFAPTSDEVGWAQEVLLAAEHSTGAVLGPNGELVDRPVVERARRILDLAGAQ